MPDKVEIRNLSKVFPGRPDPVIALDSVSLSIPTGQFVCIVGPSGCGKTTLLRILAGLDKQSYGEVKCIQEDRSKRVNSMIFQEQSIFPWMTVRDNIAYGLRMRSVEKRKADSIVNDYIMKVGLSRFADSFPFQLSGGMKQRVSIARAFANDPEILLMDEPFAALDEQTKLLLQAELLRVWEELRKTVLYVTHSIDEAIVLADRILVMTARPGRIKDICDVGTIFPRPRRVEEVKSSAQYGELFGRVWGQLRQEVLDATAQPEVVR